MAPLTIISKSGYFIHLLDNILPTINFGNHVFCGQHAIEGAICPNCQKPLLRFLSLDVSNGFVVGKSLFSQIPLLFCWTCNIAQAIFSYEICSDNKIKIVQYQKGGVESDFPYSNYPLFFPEKRVQLIQIEPWSQKTVHEVNMKTIDEWNVLQNQPKLVKPQHQVGGEPYLVNEVQNVKCKKCNHLMPFLALIADDSGTNEGFTGNEFVQVLFHYCLKCGMMAAYQICD